MASSLTPKEAALLSVISDWGYTFNVPVADLARLMEKLAQGFMAVQAMAEQEQSPAAAAERLLREAQR